MKKILLLIPAFLLAFQVSKAQTEKGTQTLGVNLSFTYQKSDHFPDSQIGNGSSSTLNSKNTIWGIGPSYSYFVADKLDIGASLGYDYLHFDFTNQSYPTSRKEHEYNAQVFLRKYLMFNEKFGIRTGPYLGYSRDNTKETYPAISNIGERDSKSDSYSAGINLGFVFYPSKSIGFAATLANLNYNHVKTSTVGAGYDSNDNVNFSFINNNLGLSVFYVIGK